MREKEKFLEDNSFAKSIVELKLASDRLVEGRGVGAGLFTVKYQLLYLIASFGEATPAELIYELNMAKSNLALIAKKMIAEGLIIQTKEPGNKKQIYYRVTDKGLAELKTKMKAIDNVYSADKPMLRHLVEVAETLRKLK